ncbi:MAG: TonB-dependent receptor [Pseudomonadota bacterium]
MNASKDWTSRRLDSAQESGALGAWALCAAVLAAVWPGAATLAQTSDRGASAVEEVTVTARRREETSQDVPIALSVVSGETLARLGEADIIALAKQSPNVTLEVSRGTNTTLTAFIRGVGQQDPVAGFEAGVGLYVDDVYFNRPHAAVLDLYDVERVEVLRGPQGTLYGRNTIGGAIKYVTRRLDDSPQLDFRLTGGSYNQIDAVITGSTPITEGFRIGGAVASFSRDGFGTNLNLGIDQYDKDIVGARVSLEWDVAENFFLRLAGDYTRDRSNPKSGHRLVVGAASGAEILDNVFDTRAGLNVPEQEVDSYGVALTAEYVVNDVLTIKNILAYRDDETFSPIDFDALPQDDLDVPVTYQNDQLSEELQLLISTERLNGVVGFYYLDANAFNEFDVVLGPTGDLIGLPGLNANTLGDVDTLTWSLFADFTYDFSEVVALSVGGRYTSDERSSRVLRRTFVGGISPTFGGTATELAVTSDFDGSETFTDFSPRASLSWRPTDTQHLYLSYSEGFKGGSFDPRGQTTAAPDLDGDGVVSEAEVFEFLRFLPETVTSYEAGLKSNLFADRLVTSLAVFFADYADVQIPGSIGIDTDGDGIQDTFTGVTTNAASADLFGVEFEGILRASDNLSFNWAVGWLDAEYNEFIDASGVDVSDEAVFQNTPEWTANVGATMEWPLALFGTPGRFFTIAQAAFRSEASQFEFRNELLDQEGFTLWDLSLVWEDDDGRWRMGVHGKNLSDEEYIVAGYNFPDLGLENNVTAFYGNPRQILGTVQYNFR